MTANTKKTKPAVKKTTPRASQVAQKNSVAKKPATKSSKSTATTNSKSATPRKPAKKIKSKYKNVEAVGQSKPPRAPRRATKPELSDKEIATALLQEEQKGIASEMQEAQLKFREEEFFRHLAETASISRSSKLSGFGRNLVYSRLAHSVEFVERFKEAYQQGLDCLEDEVKRRAFQGTMEPVFYKGDICGHVRKFSDSLAMFVLEAERRTKYGKRMQLNKTEEPGKDYDDLTDAELDAEIEKLRKEVDL